MHKSVAKWLPKGKLLVKQLLISAWSFLTLPFFKPGIDGIKSFFISNYYVKPDGLVFDGETYGYYEKVKTILDLDFFCGKCIVDLGCGQGSFYDWLVECKITEFSYIGIDFAINEEDTLKGRRIVKDNVVNVEKYLSGSDNIIILSNVLCYLNDAQFKIILSSLRTNDFLLILEPSPNLFWDAHFCGVKPIYRRVSVTQQLLTECGFSILNVAQDYWLKFGNHYMFPLSYCLFVNKIP